MRFLLVTALACAYVPVALPIDASAGTLRASTVTDYCCGPRPVPNTTVRYDADPGEANRLSAERVGATLVIRDPAGVSIGTGCSELEGGGAVCPVQEVVTYDLRLDDGDDVATVGAGQFRKGRILGGEGNDELQGGSGEDRLEGGPGMNRLVGADGRDYLDGGPDPDELFGGGGRDALRGFGGDDRLVGASGFDTHSPGSGNDTVESRDGELDYVLCQRGSTTGRALVDRFDYALFCPRLERVGGAAAVLFRPRALDLFQDEVGPRVYVGCPQDARPRCSGSLRIAVRGRQVARRGFNMRRRYDEFLTPLPRTVRRLLDRRTVVATVTLTTRDTAGRLRRQRIREAIGKDVARAP